MIRNCSFLRTVEHKQFSMHKVFAFSLLLLTAAVNAQSLDRQVIGTSGNQYVSAAATMDFTIGEPITATLTGQNGIATQGFHQGTISITSVRETLSLAELSVYPNPTTDKLTISTAIDNALWQLYTLDGKIVTSGRLNLGNTTVDVTSLAQATYMLTITTPSQRVNTYRIVKMQ
jgi:inosine-uridine nucleoside N-ribohydrolase